MTNDKNMVSVLSRCAMRALIYLKFRKKRFWKVPYILFYLANCVYSINFVFHTRALIYLKFWKKSTLLLIVFIPYLRYFTLFFLHCRCIIWQTIYYGIYIYIYIYQIYPCSRTQIEWLAPKANAAMVVISR